LAPGASARRSISRRVLLIGWIANGVLDATAGAGGLVLAATWAGVAHLASAREQRALATA
jgi:hypothetical protein